jgi:hypothetical protein
LRDFEMWRVAVASVVIDYPMVSVRMLAGNLGFMLLPAGDISIGLWAHGKLSIGNAPFVHNFYTCAG